MSLHESFRCDHCGAPSLADDEYCEACGAELTARHGIGGERVEIDLGSAGGVSDRGLVHRRNEDALFVHAADGTAAVVVCDGVSMSVAPEVAAAVAAEAAGDVLVSALEVWDGDAHAATVRAVEAARGAVLDVPWMAAGDELSAPACTLVSAVWDGSEVTIGWAGDSRAYWIGADGPARLTLDHSWAQEQVSAGLMTAEVAEADRRAHAITRWLGAGGPEDIPQVVTFRPMGPGRLILCSDGLWNYVPDADELALLVGAVTADGSPVGVARALTAVALDKGGRDNITVAVVDVVPAHVGAGSRGGDT